MPEVSLPVVLTVLGGVIWLVVGVRRTRRSACRIEWLKEQHLLLSLSDLGDDKVNGVVAVVTVDFGFGNEVWLTHNADENTMLNERTAVVNNGFRLYPTPTTITLDALRRELGLKKVEIRTLFCPS